MTPIKKTVKSSTQNLSRIFRKWHRKLGVFATFFIIFLSVTGVALNHTEDLALAHQPIKSTWLLDHYGIKSPKKILFYQNHKIQVTNNHVWLNEQLLLESDTEVISVGQVLLKQNRQPIIVIATQQSIVLYDVAGELIDKLGSESGVPEMIKAMSIEGEQVIVATPSGHYQTDSDFFEWQMIQAINLAEDTPKKTVNWIQSEAATAEQIETAKLMHRAQFLTLERIILDSHSGRILGNVGVLFMDFIALLLILLSISGLYLWMKHNKNTRKSSPDK